MVVVVSAVLLVGLLVWWLARGDAAPASDAGAAARTEGGRAPGADVRTHGPPSLAGRAVEGAASGLDPSAVRDELAALATRADAAWEVQFGLIEGTPGLTDAELLRLLASDDELYPAWLAVDLSFDGPYVAPSDLETLTRLAELLRAYRDGPGPDDALLDVFREIEERLASGGAMYLPVEVADEMLPRWMQYVYARSELGRAEATVFQELAALFTRYQEGPSSRFPPLLDLLERARARLSVARTSRQEEAAARYAEPWSRQRGDVGRLLLDPSRPLDEDLVRIITTSYPALAVVATVPEGDLERVLLRGVTLAQLTSEDGMARDVVNQLARDHVDRFLTFLSLLRVETPYGAQGLFPYGPDQAGARLYVLASALYGRSRLPRGAGAEATWLTGLGDEWVEEELGKRYPDLERDRQAAWEALATELQGVVENALR